MPVPSSPCQLGVHLIPVFPIGFWNVLNYPCILMTVFAAGHWDLNPFSDAEKASVDVAKERITISLLMQIHIRFWYSKKKKHIYILPIKKCSKSTVCVCVCVFVQECRGVGEREANWHFFRDSLAICYSTVASGVCGGSW